jgi:Outer membrane protein beta-barrel domain
MKNLLAVIVLILAGLVVDFDTHAQTKKPTTPAKKPAVRPAVVPAKKPATTATPTTTPTTTPATAPAATTETAPATVPAATSPTPAATEQPTQNMQELYDKYNGNTKKPTDTKSGSKATEPKSSKNSKSEVTEKPKKEKRERVEKIEKAKPERTVAMDSEDDGSFKFSLGLRGGGNYGTFSDPPAGLSQVGVIDYVLGYHGGLILNFGGKTFSVQPEILYSQTGVKFSGDDARLGGKFEISGINNTVQIPVLLKLSFGNSFRFFINGGGYVSYGIDSKVKSTIAGMTQTTTQKFEDNDGRIEYGAVGGAGIAIGRRDKAHLLLEGRYNYGLGKNSSDADERKLTSQTIMASLGIVFPL